FALVLARRPTAYIPYTTLFRSGRLACRSRPRGHRCVHALAARQQSAVLVGVAARSRRRGGGRARARANRLRRLGAAGDERRPRRSDEHTSELQSRENLVCRLLL